MAKKKITVRERLEQVVQQLEVYEASKRQSAPKKEESEPVYTELIPFCKRHGIDETQIIDLFLQAAKAKKEIGKKPDDKHTGFGLLKMLDDATAGLLQFQLEHNLDGIRCGDTTFRATAQMRESFDKQKCRDALLLKGVELDVIDACFDLATKVGEPFPVRTLRLPGLDD